MQIIEGGVTAAKGFKAAGMAAGIKYKNGKKDMAMVVSDKPCVTAGTFTLNRVFAAPVKWDKNIETMVLDKMKADKRISIKQLSKIFGKSKTSMFRIVDNLKADGKVRRYGSEKSGTWEVIE